MEILIIIILSLGWWYLKPYTPMDEVEYIFDDNTEVDIDEENWLTFKPADKKANTVLWKCTFNCFLINTLPLF